MQKYYLAVDIGASSGRHILAHMEQGRMILEEIHRFPNQMLEKNGELCWDVEQLFEEIKTGMKACAKAGKIPVSMGIDTWGVDFVLLDENGARIGNAVAYRDNRTDGAEELVYQVIPEKELYRRTGIQRQKYNTIYQLAALQRTKKEELCQAKALLMTPDYFHYLLTGVMASEYTIATTSQLVNPVTKDWDRELIRMLGLDEKMFQQIRQPGSVLGELSKEIQAEVGFHCKVVLPAEHDTASAVMAVPVCGKAAAAMQENADSDKTVPVCAENIAAMQENTDSDKAVPVRETASGTVASSRIQDILYISSGTWSLLGTERSEADCSEQSRIHNFTNEGGYNYRFRYLKNIMGLWMIQSVKREIGGDFSFAEICAMAEKETIASIVDCDAPRFLNPENMTAEVQKACQESGQQVPEGIAQTAAVIYRSLAVCYAKAVQETEQITGKRFRCICIVGGGSNADYLNQLTVEQTGKCVFAGPTEATAIGNAAAQMLADKIWNNLDEARECIHHSFPVRKFEPEGKRTSVPEIAEREVIL